MNRKNALAGLWLIGLGILFMVDFIWPGILILIGLSIIISNYLKDEDKPTPAAPPPPAAPITRVENSTGEVPPSGEALPPVLEAEGQRLYLASRVPEKCPACDAPVKVHTEELEFHDDQTVECPFCGFRIEI